MDFTGIYLKMTLADAIEEAWNIYTSTLDHFGFDRIIYARTRFYDDRCIDDPSNSLVLSNHDRAYLEYFIEGRHFLASPMFRWALDHTGCASWATVQTLMARGELSPEEAAVVNHNRRLRVTAGYTISFPHPSSPRTKSSASLTAREGVSQEQMDAVWKRNGRELEVLSYFFDLKVSTLPHYTGQISLTRRQREVLDWIGNGKTIEDTAAILGLTPPTVNKHLRLAREALNVETTAQAVLKAAFLNQMFVAQD